MHALANELIYEIFDWSLAMYEYDFAGRLAVIATISLVCRHWRDILINIFTADNAKNMCAITWSEVSNGAQTRLDLRKKNLHGRKFWLGVRQDWEIPSRTPSPAGWGDEALIPRPPPLLLAGIDRLEGLYVRSHDSRVFESIFTKDNADVLNELKILEVDIGSPLFNDVFIGALHNLTFLAFTNSSIPIIKGKCSLESLLHLEISNSCLTFIDLIEFLKRVPNLTSLRVAASLWRSRKAEGPSKELQKLNDIEFEATYDIYPYLQDFPSYFSLPSLTRVTLKCRDLDLSNHFLFIEFRDSYPKAEYTLLR